MAQTQIHVYRR